MSLCLPLAYYQQSQAGKAKRARTDAEQPLMNGGEVKAPPTVWVAHEPCLSLRRACDPASEAWPCNHDEDERTSTHQAILQVAQHRQASGCVTLPQEKKGTGELRTILLLGIPTAFDLTATVLMNIGLLSVTAR